MGRRDEKQGVLICGAYGMGNAGDEAVLRALVQGLRGEAPELPIRVVTRMPEQTARDLKVETVHPFALTRLLGAMKASRLFLSGGGSLIQDVTSSRSLLYYLWTLRAAKGLGCRVLLLGCGVGPVNRPRNRRLAGRVLRRTAEAALLRDRAAAQALKALGVTDIPVEVTADPALLLEPASPEKAAAFCRTVGLPTDKPWFLLAPRPWQGISERPELLAAACVRAWERYGRFPVLLAMNPARDRPFCGDLRRLLEARQIPCAVAEAPADPGLTAALIRRADRVLGMRLHALVLGAAGDLPLAGIAYDPKVSGFLSDLGAPCLALPELTEEKLAALTDQLFALPRPARAEGLRTAAARNIACVLDQAGGSAAKP